MKKIKFGYISPIEYLDVVESLNNNFHVVLLDLLKFKKYVDFYNECCKNSYIILNSFKDSTYNNNLFDIIQMSNIHFDCIIIPEQRFQKSNIIIDKTKQFIDILRNNSYDNVDVMVIPQSEENNVSDWIDCYEKLQRVDGVTHIGLSSFSVVNAFKSLTGTNDIMINRLFAAQYIVNNKLNQYGTWHHFLGLSQPREILLQRQIGLIDSNDSSSPIWHGINGITYDDSWGGLINGKIEAPVEFEMFVSKNEKSRQIVDIMNNINFIKKLCEGDIHV